MSEKLQFSIGVDLSDLDKGLNDAGKEIKKFTDANKRSFEKAGLAIAGVGASIVAIAQDIGGAGSEISQTFDNIAKAISEGDIPTLIGLVTSAIGVLIGLIPTIVSGIALVRTAFASLSLTLAANPIGAIVAAIGLAIVGVVAAVQLFSNSVDKLAVKKDLLRDVSREATKEISKEKAELMSLLAVAKDATVPYENRVKAVKKLNEISPEYLGNITLENLETAKTTEAIKQYLDVIQMKARAQAANKMLAANYEKQLQQELSTASEILKVNQKQANQYLKNKYSEETANKLITSTINNKKLLKSASDKQLESLKAEEQALLDLIKGFKGYDIELKKVAATKEQIAKENAGAEILPIPQAIANVPAVAPAMEVGYLTQMQENFDMATTNMLIALQDFNNSASDIINNAIANTFAGLGMIIGDALSGGGDQIQKLGALLLGSLGNLLVDLGKMAIQTGVGLLGIKAALKTLNPALAIGAGVALVSLGTAFSKGASNISNNIGGNGGGIANAGGTSSGNFSSSSFGSFSSSNTNEVVFRIAGSDLLGVLRRAEGNELRLG